MWLDLLIAAGTLLALAAAAWLAFREPPGQPDPAREALHRRADLLGQELDRQAHGERAGDR